MPPDVLVAILRAVAGIAVDVGSSFAFAVVIAALFLLDAPRLSALVTSGLGSENPVFRETPAPGPGRDHVHRGPRPGQRRHRRSACSS